jgi:signal transduction histidine kinase
MRENLQNIEADITAVQQISIVPTLLDVVCQTTGMGFAAIARVTDEKWVACAVRDEIAFGLKPGSELKLETTICHEIRQSGNGVIIDHVAEDPNFCTHHTPRFYGFQSYISIPIITKKGEFFGTLCAIDPKPAQLNNPKIIGMFRLFAELIAFHLQSVEELRISESRLQEEQKIAGLREQFIAILGHDLRNPLSAVSNSAQVLLQMPLDDDARKLAGIVRNSSSRMAGLIENTLDFALGRLGGGILLNRKDNVPLEQLFYQLITELCSFTPQVIETAFDFEEPVNCDSSRISQLFSNLLANALKYGRLGYPIKISASSKDALFKLSITNASAGIPQVVLDRIFQPFARGEVKPGQQGLGLGLYIASEIAIAHHGRLEVLSIEEEVTFSFYMPVRA